MSREKLPLQNIPIRSELGRQIRAGFLNVRRDRIVEKIDFRTIELRMALRACKDAK
jgi:DNA polymerase I-like protein with 3'-5' exonuclease and polymerase domains